MKIIELSISGIFQIPRKNIFLNCTLKFCVWIQEILNAKMYSFEISKYKISAFIQQKFNILSRSETMTLLMRHPVYIKVMTF